MRPVFVKSVSNVQTFVSGLEALKNRGAPECCWMAVKGEPGLGKGRTMTWWAAQNGAILLRTKVNWTPNRLMADLLAALGKAPSRDPFAQAVREIGIYQTEMQKVKKVPLLIIDEADSLVESNSCPRGTLLKAVRDLTDITELLTVVVGMERLFRDIALYKEAERRISQRIVFNRLTDEDITKMVAGLSEVAIEGELLATLIKAADGYADNVLETIAAVERFAARNPSYAGMKGLALRRDGGGSKSFVVEVPKNAAAA